MLRRSLINIIYFKTLNVIYCCSRLVRRGRRRPFWRRRLGPGDKKRQTGRFGGVRVRGEQQPHREKLPQAERSVGRFILNSNTLPDLSLPQFYRRPSSLPTTRRMPPSTRSKNRRSTAGTTTTPTAASAKMCPRTVWDSATYRAYSKVNSGGTSCNPCGAPTLQSQSPTHHKVDMLSQVSTNLL
jgi:hypothetical protein